MDKKIAESTALYPIGRAPQTKLLTITGGEFAGRRIALYQPTPGTLAFTFSSSPRQSWQPTVAIASDCANLAFDCLLAPNGDLHVVYVELSTNHLVSRRLTFDNGEWAIGDNVTVYSDGPCYDPALVIDSTGTLWVSWSAYSAPVRQVHVKSSTDAGATWGTGPSDQGDVVSHPAQFLWSKLLAASRFIHVLYVDQATGVYLRSLPLGGVTWTDPQTIASGSTLSSNFDAATSPGGYLGVVFDNQGLLFREFDGNLWSELISIDQLSAVCPQLRYRYSTPIVTWLRPTIGLLQTPMVSFRSGSTFTTPKPLDYRINDFDAVVLFSQTAQSFMDRTAEALSLDPADIAHPFTGCLIRDAGDACYLGMNAPFRTAFLNLSTAGVGGTVSCRYFDGSQWQPFTPVSSVVTLSSSTSHLKFWEDTAAMPDNWQKTTIDGESRFWVKLEVASSFTTGPVGSRITAAAQIDHLIIAR